MAAKSIRGFASIAGSLIQLRVTIQSAACQLYVQNKDILNTLNSNGSGTKVITLETLSKLQSPRNNNNNNTGTAAPFLSQPLILPYIKALINYDMVHTYIRMYHTCIWIGIRGAANDNASQRSQDPFPDADDVEGGDYDLNTSHILPGDDDDDEAFVIPGYEPTTTTTVKPNNNNNGQSERSSTRSEGGGLNPKNESNKGVAGAPVVFDLWTSSAKENILTL